MSSDRDGITVELPTSYLGEGRHMYVGYTYHGDVELTFWRGEIEQPTDTAEFRLAHSNEVVVMAGLIGYLRRCRQSAGQARGNLMHLCEDVLMTQEESEHNDREAAKRARSLASIMGGGPATRYDQPDRNWSCLVPPMTTQPGTPEEVGSVAMYTEPNRYYSFDLIFDYLPSRSMQAEERHATARLCQADIPRVGRAICELAQGEYHRDISKVIRSI